LSISTRTLWNLTKRGEIPAKRVGRSVRYFVPDLTEWAKKGRA
jgi:excisionase family DNA binding protein